MLPSVMVLLAIAISGWAGLGLLLVQAGTAIWQLELVNYIRTTHSAELPVIMITSRTMQKHRQQAEQAGANGYVTKPFNEDELLESLRGFLN